MSTRFARCVVDELSVYAHDQSRRFGPDTIVDLDEVLVPATDDRPAATLRDLLGDRIDAFVLLPGATLAEALGTAQIRDGRPITDHDAMNVIKDVLVTEPSDPPAPAPRGRRAPRHDAVTDLAE